MHIHGSGFPHIIAAPDLIQELLPGKSHIFISRQKHQQLILHRLEGHRNSRLHDLMLLPVNPHVADFNDFLPPACPFQHLFHTHQQLQHLKGLHNIILRPRPQPVYLGNHIRLGRKIYHRNSGRLHTPHQFKPILARQHNINQRQRIRQASLSAAGQTRNDFFRLHPIINRNRLIPRRLQIHTDKLRYGSIILNH